MSIFRKSSPALALLAAAILGYGLLLPQMGFYWDELPMSWIRYELGPQAMIRYFSTNRPVWGLLYQVTTRLLPQVPIYWQVFALFWRWLTALLVWAIIRELWPQRRAFALVTGLCFLLYPGFTQQWTSYLYSHFYIVLCFLLFSFLCTLWSLRSRPRYWPLTILGMLFSALNLWMLEYFFVLELFRPFLILYSVRESQAERQAPSAEAGLSAADRRASTLRRQLSTTALLWLPYLVVLVANVAWRLFVFNNQIYQPTLIPRLVNSPVSTLGGLFVTIVSNLYAVSLAAWAQIFHIPNPVVDGPRTILFFVAVVLATALLVAVLLRQEDRAEESLGSATNAFEFAAWPIGLGLAAMLFAGGPFWLTGLVITLASPANRFTLPFMLGVSLLLAGLLALLPRRLYLALAVVFIALAAGRQALLADAYRRDWTSQKELFWQMVWRAPGMTPNTIVLLNEGPLQFYADNSLTGALNWIYDPNNRSPRMDYVLFYPTSRTGGTLQGLFPNQSITYDFISEVFTGNTSQTLVFYYSPPGCLRLLDPQFDSEDHLISDISMMRSAALLSSSAWITATNSSRMPAIYGPEPAHGWCYYFEQAGLAAQEENWPRVAALGERAFALNDYPNDPVERFVFIEGYANQGSWPRAESLALQSYKVSPHYVGPLLCKLLDRIDRETPPGNVKESSLNDLRTKFSCLP